ncbi:MULTISPECIES: hypothetical protein [unclassified Caballeronia]|uniref:hypothetical protein n=1 Tax=unclassified Caballeronia TaxID=2646786 RepID=UPI00285DF9DE|nr:MULTISPECIES: hypothetical protein [unclassified Caballeronia]MDR5817191.1 hypothetical protein [Caballeronia sp. LZ033]MDR5881994.1 hypothetical protein [Caballeronia sp. LZ032]
MNLLLLSDLPRVEESRPHYDAMLNLEPRETRYRKLARFFRRLTSRLFRRA